jgi:four helix bundle protein
LISGTAYALGAGMTPEELRRRLTDFGIAVVTFCKPLWLRPETRNAADQLSRSATSVGSNYRIACRARSKREFISKIGIALEEADESVGWLELLLGTEPNLADSLAPLLKESREIVAILSASKTTAQRRS